MHAKRFVTLDGLHSYTFPDNTQDWRTNFKDLMPRTVRFPGADGGFWADGLGKATSEVGNIQFSVMLVSSTRAGMEALRDALNAIAGWGIGRLYAQPTDPEADERWAWCRPNNITMSERPAEHTDLFQKVQLSFQAVDPYWYTPGNLTVWGDSEWDAGEWTSDNLESISGTASYDTTQANGGNALIHPAISILANDTCVNPRLQRIVDAAVVDEVQYNGTLEADDVLAINCRALSVTLNGDDAYDQLSFVHPEWLRLMPGNNTVRIKTDGNMDMDVTIGFYERYF